MRLRARSDSRNANGARRIRPEPIGSIGPDHEKQFDDDPGLKQGQGNSQHHEQHLPGGRDVDAEREPEKEPVIQVGEAIDDEDRNRPPTSRSGCDREAAWPSWPY